MDKSLKMIPILVVVLDEIFKMSDEIFAMGAGVQPLVRRVIEFALCKVTMRSSSQIKFSFIKFCESRVVRELPKDDLWTLVN
jgi:hypothetical protein